MRKKDFKAHPAISSRCLTGRFYIKYPVLLSISMLKNYKYERIYFSIKTKKKELYLSKYR